MGRVMNYNDMTDFEINKLVAERLGLYTADNIFRSDYCNNPLAAWPIILENKISIRHDKTLKKSWAELNLGCGYSQGVPYKVEHENPLRAGMIVYLMMNQGAIEQ